MYIERSLCKRKLVLGGPGKRLTSEGARPTARQMKYMAHATEGPVESRMSILVFQIKAP